MIKFFIVEFLAFSDLFSVIVIIQVSEKIAALESLLKFLRVSQCLFPANDTTTIPLVTHRDDILALLLSSAADAHSSLRAAAISGLVGLLSLTGLLSRDQVRDSCDL